MSMIQPQATTTGSSGVPMGLRKKAEDMEPEDWRGLVDGLMKFLAEESEEPEHAQDDGGHAAGIVYAEPSGTVLLLKRSPKEENYAGHWALPGGKADAGEAPEQAARREAGEEMGSAPDGPMKLLSSVKTPTGMTFHTFRQDVPARFEPKLNDEHTDHVWARLDDLPEPLHPRVAETLGTLGQDADFEESKHHRDAKGEFALISAGGAEGGSNFSKSDLNDWGGRSQGGKGGSGWSAQELADYGDKAPNIDLAATDSALKLALDRSDSVRNFDKDGRMHVETANICKACVSPYLGEEIPGWQDLNLDPNKIYKLLRAPDEIEKAAPSANGIQLLQQHTPVSVDDHKPYDTVGSVGSSASWEAPYLKNSLHFWTQAGIDDVESKKKRELSPGYHYKPDMTPGKFEGENYDGVMRDIVFNHVALVGDGRQGDDVVVGDSAESVQWALLEQAIMSLAG